MYGELMTGFVCDISPVKALQHTDPHPQCWTVESPDDTESHLQFSQVSVRDRTS
jgi:hypothetical protein